MSKVNKIKFHDREIVEFYFMFRGLESNQDRQLQRLLSYL